MSENLNYSETTTLVVDKITVVDDKVEKAANALQKLLINSLLLDIIIEIKPFGRDFQNKLHLIKDLLNSSSSYISLSKLFNCSISKDFSFQQTQVEQLIQEFYSIELLKQTDSLQSLAYNQKSPKKSSKKESKENIPQIQKSPSSATNSNSTDKLAMAVSNRTTTRRASEIQQSTTEATNTKRTSHQHQNSSPTTSNTSNTSSPIQESKRKRKIQR